MKRPIIFLPYFPVALLEVQELGVPCSLNCLEARFLRHLQYQTGSRPGVIIRTTV